MFARLAACYFLSFAFVGVFAPYFSLYLHDIGTSAGDIAILMAVMQAMRVFGPSLWASWVGKGLSIKRAMVLIALGSLGGLTVFMFATSLTGKLLAMAVLALFWNGALPLLETLTFDQLGTRSARYGTIRLWGSLGFIVAVLAVGRLAEAYSIAVVLWACWLILLSLLLLSAGLPGAAAWYRSRVTTSLPTLRTTLAKPTVATVLAASFLMAAAHGALNVFYSIHLSQNGYGGLAIGVFWTLGVTAEILVLMMMPRLIRLFTPRTLLIACFAAASLRFALIGWLIAWVSLAVFAQLLHAMSFGAHHAVSVSAVNRWFAGGSQAKGQALYASFYGAGTLVGSLACGYLWPVLGNAWTFTASSVLALSGMILIILFMRADKA